MNFVVGALKHIIGIFTIHISICMTLFVEAQCSVSLALFLVVIIVYSVATLITVILQFFGDMLQFITSIRTVGAITPHF